MGSEMGGWMMEVGKKTGGVEQKGSQHDGLEKTNELQLYLPLADRVVLPCE